MEREDLRTLIRALRDLDRWNHQPLADLVAREFAQRPMPSKRCPSCRGPLTGWMAGSGVQVIYCRICTSFDEASAFLAQLAEKRDA